MTRVLIWAVGVPCVVVSMVMLSFSDEGRWSPQRTVAEAGTLR